MNKGSVFSISIAKERGQLKKEIAVANINNLGIENDGHSGDWTRQVTCLSYESLLKSNKEHNLTMGAGDFAENILISGLDFTVIKVGDKIQLGETVVLEVSQIGKEDHPSIVTKTFGVSLLPYEGLFCKVIAGGKLQKGDIVQVL